MADEPRPDKCLGTAPAIPQTKCGTQAEAWQDQTPQLVAMDQTLGTIVGIGDDHLRGSGKRQAAAGWGFQATAQVQFRVM